MPGFNSVLLQLNNHKFKFTCPVFLDEMTHTSAGFSMATIALAASSSFSQVFFRLMMYTPGDKNGKHKIMSLDYLKGTGDATVKRLTVTFPLVDILLHLEVQVGASQVG